MQTIHYSMVDIVLIIATLEAVLIYGLVVIAHALPTPSRICRHLLGLLFIAIALDALAILLIWQPSIREVLTPYGRWVVVFTCFAFTAKGPLLLLFVQTLVTPRFRLRPLHALHLLTVIATVSVAAFYSLDTTRITYAIEVQVSNPGTFAWWTLIRLLPCLYALAAIYTLRKMAALYDSHYTSDEYQYAYWIQGLVWGFFAQWSLNFGVHIAGNHLPYEISNALGVANDIAIVLLINALLFYSFKVMRTLAPLHPSALVAPHIDVAALAENTTETPIAEKEPDAFSLHVFATGAHCQAHYLPHQIMPAENRENDDALIAIVTGIDSQQLHLNQTLNVEKFAEAIELAPRDVSRLINAHFNCSFSEFINAFRTYEAERLLRSPEHTETTIIDIIGMAGFNSKSAFHRFFKRFTELSPSEYRKSHSPVNETE